MTHNSVWIEASATGLRAYFMPEDNKSTIYVYDVDQRSSATRYYGHRTPPTVPVCKTHRRHA